MRNQLVEIWFYFVKNIIFEIIFCQTFFLSFDHFLLVPYWEFFVEWIRIVAQFWSKSMWKNPPSPLEYPLATFSGFKSCRYEHWLLKLYHFKAKFREISKFQFLTLNCHFEEKFNQYMIFAIFLSGYFRENFKNYRVYRVNS